MGFFKKSFSLLLFIFIFSNLVLNRLNARNRDKEKVCNNMTKATLQLNLRKRNLENLELEMAYYDKQLDIHSKRLILKTKDFLLQKELFKKVLVNTYRYGEFNYFLQLIKANSFSDFIYRFEAIRLILRHKHNILLRYLASYNNLQREIRVIKIKRQRKVLLLQKEKNEIEKLKKLISKFNFKLDKIREEEYLGNLASKEVSKASFLKASHSTGLFCFPTSGGKLVRNFLALRGKHYHKGVDIINKLGAPIYAVDFGVVTLMKADPLGYGYYIVISHGRGLATLYAHMYRSTVNVSLGQKVSKGQQIACIGNNGRSTTPHLHFEVHKSGKVINPLNFLTNVKK